MEIPKDYKFTENHEWLRVKDGQAWIGITHFAQSELGEIVFVEVDTLDEELEAKEPFGTIEAVKTTSDMFMPVSGKVLEFNPNIDEEEDGNPGLINEDPYDAGWIVKVELTNPEELDELLDADSYEKIIS